jgi:hypothetical protein
MRPGCVARAKLIKTKRNADARAVLTASPPTLIDEEVLRWGAVNGRCGGHPGIVRRGAPVCRSRLAGMRIVRILDVIVRLRGGGR